MDTFLKWHRGVSRWDQNLSEFFGSFMGLLVRSYVGWQFFKAGLVKLGDWSATLELFREEYHVPLLPPELAAVMGAGGELVFPILLVLGLFSRPAALGLFAVNAMAVISYPQLFKYECSAAINDHFYWGALLLVIVAFGPGRLSLDAVLERKRVPQI